MYHSSRISTLQPILQRNRPQELNNTVVSTSLESQTLFHFFMITLLSLLIVTFFKYVRVL